MSEGGDIGIFPVPSHESEMMKATVEEYRAEITARRDDRKSDREYFTEQIFTTVDDGMKKAREMAEKHENSIREAKLQMSSWERQMQESESDIEASRLVPYITRQDVFHIGVHVALKMAIDRAGATTMDAWDNMFLGFRDAHRCKPEGWERSSETIPNVRGSELQRQLLFNMAGELLKKANTIMYIIDIQLQGNYKPMMPMLLNLSRN
ncbi:hypothetical protein O1611_g6119 [Lasiodiplodia mahajangana]|uniref:Uncharacterized protein n=1 Tax=Lasiodiplodia mahajangana TaxID=1108764 RepID=A0ACC2JJB3_9PEZI|nr:hypothetical protein O1611_g6119 [Lasiodiplodia mahajangana]